MDSYFYNFPNAYILEEMEPPFIKHLKNYKGKKIKVSFLCADHPCEGILKGIYSDHIALEAEDGKIHRIKLDSICSFS